VAKPAPLPANRFVQDGFVASVREEDLVYFLCNVGDGDSQVVLLPALTLDDGTKRRRLLVVDAATTDKVPALLKSIEATGLLGGANGSIVPGSIALAVASHPHLDHIGGMAQVLETYRGKIAEFWDPGYYHTIPAYSRMMAAVEKDRALLYAQPTSGLRRWIDNVVITVLAPSIQLRNRFDSYGVELNDSSLSMRVEFPASRVQQRDQERNYVKRRTQSLLLGADAQTLSWAYVFTDYPQLMPSESPAAKALKMATGGDDLRANVLKVAHHASKHGVNLELIERINPDVTLISSVADAGSYNFPHTVAQELIREGKEATTGNRAAHKPDHELGIFYTCDSDDAGVEVGSIAIVMQPTGKRTIWRFRDKTTRPIDFAQAMRWT
jgi:hypothetical protein